MTRRDFGVAGLGLIPSLSLNAATPWENRAPGQWSADDVDELLVNSPWAKTALVAFTGDRGGRGSFPGSGGGRTRGGLPGGVPGGGWPGTYAFDQDDPVVRWESALPIRQALAVRRGDPAIAQTSPTHYSILLTGLPFGAAPMAEKPERILAGCALSRKGSRQIRPERLEILPRPGAPGVLFLFSRERKVVAEDRNIEFLLVLDDYQLTCRFKLKDMLYHDRLEL